MMPFNFSFFVCTTIWPKIMILIDLFLLFAHDRLTKIYGLHSFISFIYTRPFDQNIWHSFIYSFFCKRPFDQNLGSSFIYSLFSGRPSDQKLGSSFIYFFSLHTTIRPNIGSTFIYFFFCARPFDQKIGSSLIYFIYLHTTIRLKCIALFHTLFLHARPFDQKLVSSLIYTFYLYTTIRPKLGFIFTLWFIFFLIVPIFCTLYSWQYCLYNLYFIFMAIWSLSRCFLLLVGYWKDPEGFRENGRIQRDLYSVRMKGFGDTCTTSRSQQGALA